MEKVWRSFLCRLARPVTTEESIPPLRNAPRGTSAINLRCTDWSSKSHRCDFASSYEILFVSTRSESRVISYHEAVLSFFPERIRKWPGKSFLTCRKIEFGAGM